MRAALLSTLFGVFLCGCFSGPGEPIDLVRSVPVTTVRVEGEILPPIWVRFVTDKRPLVERGNRKVLGTSHLRDSVLVEPTHVVLVRALARALILSGVTSQASIRDSGQPYVLEIEISSCTATFGEGIQNLLLFLPTSAINAVCEFALALKDRDGRLFLKHLCKGAASGSASVLSGLESTAAEVLAKALRSAIDQALVAVHQAPHRYWSKYR